MKPLCFKEAVQADVQSVFLNTGEFAGLHTIKYDGKVYKDISASIQEAEQAERTQLKDDHTQGIFRAQAVLFCARADLDGKLPEPGTWLEVNNGKNPKFFNKYQVGAAGDEMGMVRIELGRFAQ